MPRFLSLLMLIITGTISIAQDPGKYLFSHIGTKDGLTSDITMSVREDKKGYIWIVNDNSLQRYDGKRFLTIRHEPGNPRSLPPGFIYGLDIDKKNRIWLMFGGFVTGYFSQEDYSFHKVEVNASKDELHRAAGGIFITRDGEVLLLAQKRGIYTFNEAKNEFAKKWNSFELPAGHRPNIIFQGEDRIFWIATDEGLIKYNPKTKVFSYKGHNIDNDPYIEATKDLIGLGHILFDKQKRLWLGGWGASGMYIKSYDPVTGKISNWQNQIGKTLGGSYYVLDGFRETSSGDIWVFGQNLFAKFNNETKVFDPVSKNVPGEFSIRYDKINDVVEDREKNLWVTCDRGLFRFNPPAQLIGSVKMQRVGDTTNYTPDVTDILQLRNGNILVSTWGSGVFSYDSNFKPLKIAHFIEAHRKKKESMTWSMIERPNGDIWRTQQGGTIVIWYAASGKTEVLHPAVFENSTIRQVAEDGDGNLWFGTQRGYVVMWDRNSKEFILKHKTESIIPRLISDSAGNIWVATESNGLFYLEKGTGKIIGHYVRNNSENSIRSNAVSEVAQYNDSLIVVIAEGLNLLNTKTGKSRYIGPENNLPTLNIYAVITDKQGYIWMPSTAGLISYHPQIRKMSIYSSPDGVYTNSFNGSSMGMLKDGRIGVGTFHDLMIFDPKKLTVSNYTPPPVEITGIILMNKRIREDSLAKLKRLELMHHQNSLTIEFSTLTYQNMHQVFYQLEGMEKEWQEAGLYQAVYSYIKPGNYVFKVACKDEKGNIQNITSLPVIVKPPFWKTWWFYSLLVIFSISVFLLFDRQRIRRIRHEQEMRASIAGNLHEEVNTVLQNINVLSEIARIKADTEPEQSKEYIYEIQQKSRNMVVAMSDVLWSIDPANDNMKKTLDRIHEVAEALKHKHSVEVNIQTDKEVLDLNLSMRVRHEFILIYKLAMLTLIEELKAPGTTVQLDYSKGKLHLQIFALHLQLPRNNNAVSKNIQEIKTRASYIPGATVDIQSDEKGTWINFEMKRH
jgi:ligand-binding sensor domain-containing protein